MPQDDGFDFINDFIKIETTQSQVILLSSFISPLEAEVAFSKNIKFIEKPLTLEKLIMSL